MRDIRTAHGWYRVVRRFGRVIERLYCGNSDNRWYALTGDPEQADLEAEIAEALAAPDYTTRFDARVRS